MFAGYQITGSFYTYSATDAQPSPFTLDTSMRSAEALSGTVYTHTYTSTHVLIYFKFDLQIIFRF